MPTTACQCCKKQVDRLAWYGTVPRVKLSYSEVRGMKLTLDVENTVTKRDGKIHLDPFEPENSLTMIGVLTDQDVGAGTFRLTMQMFLINKIIVNVCNGS